MRVRLGPGLVFSHSSLDNAGKVVLDDGGLVKEVWITIFSLYGKSEKTVLKIK